MWPGHSEERQFAVCLKKIRRGKKEENSKEERLFVSVTRRFSLHRRSILHCSWRGRRSSACPSQLCDIRSLLQCEVVSPKSSEKRRRRRKDRQRTLNKTSRSHFIPSCTSQSYRSRTTFHRDPDLVPGIRSSVKERAKTSADERLILLGETKVRNSIAT